MTEYCEDDDCECYPTCTSTPLQKVLYDVQVDVFLKYSPLDIPHEEFMERAKKHAEGLNE